MRFSISRQAHVHTYTQTLSNALAITAHARLVRRTINCSISMHLNIATRGRSHSPMQERKEIQRCRRDDVEGKKGNDKRTGRKDEQKDRRTLSVSRKWEGSCSLADVHTPSLLKISLLWALRAHWRYGRETEQRQTVTQQTDSTSIHTTWSHLHLGTTLYHFLKERWHQNVAVILKVAVTWKTRLPNLPNL